MERACFEDVTKENYKNCKIVQISYKRRSLGRPHKRLCYSHSGRNKGASSLIKTEKENYIVTTERSSVEDGDDATVLPTLCLVPF
jgi:hypothetical protein